MSEYSMGGERAISGDAHEALSIAMTLRVSIDLICLKTGRKDLIDRWHNHCEVVVADLMGAFYHEKNPLDVRKPREQA